MKTYPHQFSGEQRQRIGIDYSLGVNNHLDGTHYVLATEEENYPLTYNEHIIGCDDLELARS